MLQFARQACREVDKGSQAVALTDLDTVHVTCFGHASCENDYFSVSLPSLFYWRTVRK